MVALTLCGLLVLGEPLFYHSAHATISSPFNKVLLILNFSRAGSVAAQISLDQLCIAIMKDNGDLCSY